MATAFKYVGKATKRKDGPQKLTGQEQFTGDMALPRMAHARLVNSIYANALIRGIDDLHRLLTERRVSITSALTVLRHAERLILAITPAESKAAA